MSNMPKPNKVVNGHWWQRIKWRNLLLFFVFLIIILLPFILYYNSWASAVTSPSEPATLSFTVMPAGGGFGDKLVSEPVLPPLILHRSGELQVVSPLLFGPFEKAVMITKVNIILFVHTKQDSIIEVSLSYKDEMMSIGSAQVYGDPNYPASGNLTSVRLSENFDLLIPRGNTGKINIIAKDVPSFLISSDTYVWFEVLQAKYGYVPSLREIIAQNPLVVALIIVILPLLFKSGVFYETESERQQKEQLVILRTVRDLLRRQSPPRR